MDSARATAYNPNYVGAIANAINNSRLPYSVKTCTTSGSPAVTSCATKDYTYDGSVAMRNALNNLLGSSNQGVYFQWDLKQRQTLVAKDLYDAAVTSETQAIGARDQLVALKTGVAGSVVTQTIWNGAVPILQQADNKGGIR